MGKTIALLERVVKSENFTLTISGFDGKSALQVLRDMGTREECTLSELLHKGIVSIMWKSESNEFQNLLAAFQSIDFSSINHSRRNPLFKSTRQRKGGKIVKQIEYRSAQFERATEHETILNLLFDLCGHRLFSLAKHNLRSKTHHLFNHSKGRFTHTSPDLLVHVQEAFKKQDSSDILYDLFEALINDSAVHEPFFQKGSQLIAERPELKYSAPLRILEACLYYISDYREEKQKYKDLHERFSLTLQSYETKTSTQSKSSRATTGTTLEMSEPARLGALDLVLLPSMKPEQAQLIERMPTFQAHYNFFCSEVQRVSKSANIASAPTADEKPPAYSSSSIPTSPR